MPKEICRGHLVFQDVVWASGAMEVLRRDKSPKRVCSISGRGRNNIDPRHSLPHVIRCRFKWHTIVLESGLAIVFDESKALFSDAWHFISFATFNFCFSVQAKGLREKRGSLK